MRNEGKDIRRMTSSTSAKWEKRTIGDLCIEDRRIIEPESKLARTLPYLSLENVESVTGRILLDPRQPNSGEGRSTTFFFDQQHILYGKLRPYLNKVALPSFVGRCTTELIPLRPREGISRTFLAALLRKPQVVDAAMQNKTGARMPRASIKHIMRLTVLVPKSFDKQEIAAQELMRNLAASLNAKKSCLEQVDLIDALCSRLLQDFGSTKGA